MAILEGYEKQRRYIARDNGDHQLISEWTNANTVEFDDLETLPTKIDNINDDIDTINTELNKKLNLSGGTMTGVLKAQSGKTSDTYDGALDMNNSNIFNLNSIYTADPSNSAAEGIHFRRDDTHVDTLWMANGNLMFVPNRELGTGTTIANSQKVGRFSTNPTSGQLVVANGTDGEIKTSGFTISTSVPANAKFTDANVTQTNTTTNANYRLLFSATADNTTRTEGARKSGDLAYNPSTKLLVVPNITVTNHINCNGDMVLQTGFVCNHGYTAVSGDTDTTVNKKYSYLAFRPNQQTRKGGNDIRVYNDYVATAENLAIKLWNDGHIESENIELFAGTPYIDFHRNNSTADYTGRIINKNEGYID